MDVLGVQAVKQALLDRCMRQGFYFSRKVNLSGRLASCSGSRAGALTQPVSAGGQDEEEPGLELWVQQN